MARLLASDERPGSFLVAIEIVLSYAREMYFVQIGEFISDPTRAVLFGDCRLTRQQIKHIVEQRKKEGRGLEAIYDLLRRVVETLECPDFEMPNTNARDYPDSILRVKMFSDWGRGVVVVLDREAEGIRDVITAFSRKPAGIRSLQKKTL